MGNAFNFRHKFQILFFLFQFACIIFLPTHRISNRKKEKIVYCRQFAYKAHTKAYFNFGINFLFSFFSFTLPFVCSYSLVHVKFSMKHISVAGLACILTHSLNRLCVKAVLVYHGKEDILYPYFFFFPPFFSATAYIFQNHSLK